MMPVPTHMIGYDLLENADRDAALWRSNQVPKKPCPHFFWHDSMTACAWCGFSYPKLNNSNRNTMRMRTLNLNKQGQVSPVVLEAMLHVYYAANYWAAVRQPSRAHEEAFQALQTFGLITGRSQVDGENKPVPSFAACESEFKLCFTPWMPTPKGRAWVQMLLATPLPASNQVWVDPRTHKEVKDPMTYGEEAEQ